MIVKVCKKHGELTKEQTYKRPDNGSLRCNFCQNDRTKRYAKKERTVLLQRIVEVEKLVHETLKERPDIIKIYDSLMAHIKLEIEQNPLAARGDYVLKY